MQFTPAIFMELLLTRRTMFETLNSDAGAVKQPSSNLKEQSFCVRFGKQ